MGDVGEARPRLSAPPTELLPDSLAVVAEYVLGGGGCSSSDFEASSSRSSSSEFSDSSDCFADTGAAFAADMEGAAGAADGTANGTAPEDEDAVRARTHSAASPPGVVRGGAAACRPRENILPGLESESESKAATAAAIEAALRAAWAQASGGAAPAALCASTADEKAGVRALRGGPW